MNPDDTLPSYDELLARADAPAGSSWGLWGHDDVFGCLNLLTPDRVVRAAGLVRRGLVFPLNLERELPDPPLFGRSTGDHEVSNIADGTIHDDVITGWNTQSSSQWDGFRHVAHRAHGFYNGIDDEEHGVHHWARRGIAGRGVLVDVARRRWVEGRSSAPGESDAIDVEELHACLEAEQVALEPGDVLLVRTGWLSWYRSLDAAGRAAAASSMAGTGMRTGEELLRFLWDSHVAAVAADNPALEVFPPGSSLSRDDARACFEDPMREPMVFAHRSLLALLGIPIGELWDLDALAEDCATEGTYDCLLTSAPLNIRGGVATPPNALALR